MALPIGLQLFTVRDSIKDDFAGTLKRVAEMGYEGVEWAGLHGNEPADVAKMIGDLGLKSAGTHVGLNGMEDPGWLIEEAGVLGYDLVTVPSIPGEMRESADGYKQAAKQLNDAAARLKDAGLKVSYHNHDFEFARLDSGERGIDILIAETDPALVGFELDTGWAYVGGEDPQAFAAKLSGRLPLLHIKDFSDPSREGMCEVGTGAIDWKSLVAAAAGWGTRWLVIEQDHGWVNDDALESAKVSLENLKAVNG